MIFIQWLQKILNTFYSASQPRIARFFFFFTNIYIYKAILSTHFESFTLSFSPIRLALPANYPTCFNLLSSLKLSLVYLSHIILFTFTPLFCTSSSYSTIFLSCLSLTTSSNPDVFYVLLCPVSLNTLGSRIYPMIHPDLRLHLALSNFLNFQIASFDFFLSFLKYCVGN